MERPQRNQDAKTKQQERENEILGATGDRILLQMLDQPRDAERARPGLGIKRQQTDQSQQRADAEIEGNLERGVILALSPAPHPDHDERGHQGKLVENVKEEQVQRREGAEDAARHDQQEDVKLLLPLLDFPGNASGGERDDCGHENQAQVDAVDTHIIADAEGFNPRPLVDEPVSGGIRGSPREQQEHQDRQQRRPQRGEHRHPAHDHVERSRAQTPAPARPATAEQR